MNKLIYVDCCSETNVDRIKRNLHLDIVYRLPKNKWSVNDTMGIITIPNVILAVINNIDEIAVMEMSLLNFMCKPILVTAPRIANYKVIVDRVVDHIDPNCNLMDNQSNFVTWYKEIFRRTNV